MINKTFSERVVEAALSIPAGYVATYGDIAAVCGGGRQSARSISGILGRASKKGIKNIPWHRIVYSGGKIWMDTKYDKARKKLYKKEGIEVDDRGYIQNFTTIRYIF